MLPSPQLLNQVANFIQEKGKFSYYCLFLLGKEAGLRVSEAVNFNLSLKKKPNLYLIHGKKHKKRVIFIDPSVINELKQNHWKSQPTNRFSFAHFLQRTKQELKISKEIELTPHSLRRCFATYQANSGMPLPVLQKVLGHSSIRTTALYWKNSEEPKEKIISDKWLSGKVPKEPTKPIEGKPKNLLKFSRNKNRGKIFFDGQRKFLETREIPPNIQNNSENSEQKSLITENKILKEKVKQLEQTKKEQEQIIINLKNAKERLKKELVRTQQEKETLLKLLSNDLQKQKDQLSKRVVKPVIQELEQELIAQIQVLIKN